MQLEEERRSITNVQFHIECQTLLTEERGIVEKSPYLSDL